jgi:UDP:flavonoid glycosyltransferase YjiC (YdhE family)
VPLLCLPMGRDQNDNAAKVAYHGCGLKLSPKASAHKLGKAVLRLLEEPFFGRKAEDFAQKILLDSNKDTAILEIESLLSSIDHPHPSIAGM